MVKHLQIEIDDFTLKCGDIIYENNLFYLKCLFCENKNITHFHHFTEHILTAHLKQNNDSLNLSQIVDNSDDQSVIDYLEYDNNETSKSEADLSDDDYKTEIVSNEEIEYLDNEIIDDNESDYNFKDELNDLFIKKEDIELINNEFLDNEKNLENYNEKLCKEEYEKKLLPSNNSGSKQNNQNKIISEPENEKTDSENTTKDYTMEELLQLSSIKKGLFQCGICPKIYNKDLYLMRHLKDHLNGAGECSICGKYFTFKRCLFEHYYYAHKEVENARREKEKKEKEIDEIKVELNDMFKIEMHIDATNGSEDSQKTQENIPNKFTEKSFYIITKNEDETLESEEHDNIDVQGTKLELGDLSDHETEDENDKSVNVESDSIDGESESMNLEIVKSPPIKKIKFTKKKPIRRSLRGNKPPLNLKKTVDILPKSNSSKSSLLKKQNNKSFTLEENSDNELFKINLEERLRELYLDELVLLSITNDELYTCAFCEREFERTKSVLAEFEAHLNDHLISKSNSEKEEKSDESNVISKTEMKSNLNQCILCTESFETKDALTSHIKDHSIKNEKTLSKSYKRPAKKKKVKSNEKQCLVCKRVFKYHHELKAHTEAHIPDKLKCDRCGKRYPNEWSLRDHIDWHTGYGYKCSECGAEFFEEHLYNRHLRDHFGINIYPCSYNCGRRFLSSTFKRKHERIVHLKLAIFQCELCGRKFMQAGQLNMHRATAHSEARPFNCDICNKTFKVYARLKRHKIVVHSTELAYECQICKSSFKALSNLRQHEKIHSNIKDYQCEHCKATFSQAAGLYSHLKVKHKIENPSARKRKPSDDYVVEYIEEDEEKDEDLEFIDYEDSNDQDLFSHISNDGSVSEKYEIIYEDFD